MLRISYFTLEAFLLSATSELHNTDKQVRCQPVRQIIGLLIHRLWENISLITFFWGVNEINKVFKQGAQYAPEWDRLDTCLKSIL